MLIYFWIDDLKEDIFKILTIIEDAPPTTRERLRNVK